MELVLPRTRSYSSTGLVPYGHLSCRELYELVLGKTQFHDIEFLEKIYFSRSQKMLNIYKKDKSRCTYFCGTLYAYIPHLFSVKWVRSKLRGLQDVGIFLSLLRTLIDILQPPTM